MSPDKTPLVSPENATPLLSMRGVSKGFAGVQALDRVDFFAYAGEVHALMGENGAGKSTLLKTLTGVYSRDSGEVTLAGRSFHPASPLQAQDAGVSTVYQEVNLIPQLSVAENICLGRQPKRLGFISYGAMRRRATAALARLGLKLDVGQPLSSYSIAIQQMVAIARALDVSAQLLVLDEPTSSLDADEVRRLFDVMRSLKSEGLGIVFVTHFIEQVYEVTDRITVLRNGKLVGEYKTAALPRMELVTRMLGREHEAPDKIAAAHARSVADAPQKPVLIQARGISHRKNLSPVDLDIRVGEITGIAGLLGSGRTEIARMLFGIDAADQGSVRINDVPAKLHSPRQAIRHGFGFCSEDRKTEGIIPELSIRENIILALQARRGWLRKYSRTRQNELANQYIKALNVATPDAEKPIGQLSGGNQQKVLLGRWLASNPKFLIVDEPTRGIDIGAKAEIEKLMNGLCGEGMAILFISSELEEVVRSSHKVVVMRDRRKVAELGVGEVTEQKIMQTIAGEHA